ncbi:2751_t:CDS:2 [Diversispora eburnea]|uniref:Translocation protein SEC62 n=1 Tax=Diversispora eburnea TaxID=1213867 RepID=A0A9N8YQX0_9GLOM|nr:2751_t:CDS:2 [Diversispora eburnea]
MEKAPPTFLKTIKYLRSSKVLKTRPGILNGKRVEYFKGKTAVKALLKEPFKKLKNVPKITNENEASQVLEEILEFAFYARVERSGGAESSRNKILKITPVQLWSEDQYYVWLYEGSQLLNSLLGVLLMLVVFVAVLFPLWPAKLRDSVWYVSVFILGIFGMIMALAVFRLVLFIVTMIIVPPGIWIFPNLFAECGVLESFVPLWDLHTTVEDEDEEFTDKKDD